ALLDLAAKKWNVDRGSLTASGGKIQHASSNRAARFGDLTKGEKLVLDITDRIALKPATEWKIMGTSTAKVDGRAGVTGRHVYTPDITGTTGVPAASGNKTEVFHPAQSPLRQGSYRALTATESALLTASGAEV
ncbi:MAG: hypothetical protein ACREH8_08415, partial [Opitutaceae bacterium]